MPGIVGIVRKHAYEGIDQDLQVMIDSIRHEPSYVGGRYVNRESAVAVGWLSHEGTLGASMPIMTRDKRRVLIIVGEHFSGNCRSGVSQKEGVAAVLSELAQGFEGPEAAFLKSLNGWFAGIIIDLDRMAVTLFNDRYGMSRVYFHESEGEFLFGSEAKALLRIRPKLRKVEPKSVAEYLRFNCVMGNRTLFSDIGLLPVASSWRFAGSVTPQRSNYFEYSEWEQQSLLRPVEFQGEFDSTVSRIFPYYMGGSDRVGFSLTAGLDTRAILASAKSEGQGGPCYTFGGLWGETFDIRTARKLAEVCHLSHQTIRIDEAFLQQFSDYADKSVYISDGTHDALGAHDVYFNQVARKIAPIRMTGKFGSEVVRIRRLIPSWEFPRKFLQPGFAPVLNDVLPFDKVSRRSDPLTRVVTEEIPWYEYGRVSVEQAEIIMRTPYMDNDLVRLMYRAPHELRASRDLQARYVRATDKGLSDVPTNMGRATGNGQPLGKIAYGLFWALFKVEFIYLYATPHWMTRLDRGLEKLQLERIIAGRQKFEGYRIWFKTHLSEYLRDKLLNPQAYCNEFFDKEWVQKAVMRHTSGTHNYLNEINKMLTLELIGSTLVRP